MEKEKYQIWIGKVAFSTTKEPLREIKVFRLNDCKEWSFIGLETKAREFAREHKIPVFRTKTYNE